MSTQLPIFLNRIGQNFTRDWLEIRDIQQWMLDEIFRKFASYPVWKKKCLFSWVSIQKYHGNKGNLNAIFFTKKLDELFRFFLKNMFPFDIRQLKLMGIETGSAALADSFFEYEYQFKPQEIEYFLTFQSQFNHKEPFEHIISYVFNLIITVFGKMLSDILKNNSQIIMLCANYKENGDKKPYLHFVVVARPAEYAFLKSYLQMMIFHFAEKLPQVPNEFLEKLRKQSDKIYPLALQEYPHAKANLLAVLYTLQKKTHVLNSITPILDILNFICSRVEDSIFRTDNLVEQIIKDKFTKDPKIITSIMQVFDYINEKASLFSTFQSNNRANLDNQFQLFIFYTQFFCTGGLDAMLNNPTISFPDILTKNIEKEDLLGKKNSLKYAIFSQFIFRALTQLGNPAFEIAFKKIFNSTIFDTNETFFECFLQSLNHRFKNIVKDLQNKIPNYDFSFENTIHIILVLLFNLVDQVFIAPTPKEASEHFRDKLSRYTYERLALRVLELRVYKDIPLSDNNWQDYYLSRNKNYLRALFKPYFEIPDLYFFSPERLLKINMIYDRTLPENTCFFEEWIVERILKQFNLFIDEINSKITEKTSTNQLRMILNDFFTKGIIDGTMREHLEEFADFFVSIWTFNS